MKKSIREKLHILIDHMSDHDVLYWYVFIRGFLKTDQ